MRTIRHSPAADAETVEETIDLLRRIGATGDLKPLNVKNVKRYKKVDLGTIKLKKGPKAKVVKFKMSDTVSAPLIVGAEK